MKNRPIPERETILVEILDLAETPQQKDINENKVDSYLKGFSFYLTNSTFEECESADQKVKINLIHNIGYDMSGIDVDGDPMEMRIFTVETKNSVRYFTAGGSSDILGRPREHTKEEFIKLLTQHSHLKDNHLVKYMNNLILQAELIEALPIHDVKEKKPKM
jgi:hypothetical protein